MTSATPDSGTNSPDSGTNSPDSGTNSPECSACSRWAEKERDLFNMRGTLRMMEREQIARWLKDESERLDDPALYAAAERILAFAHKVKR